MRRHQATTKDRTHTHRPETAGGGPGHVHVQEVDYDSKTLPESRLCLLRVNFADQGMKADGWKNYVPRLAATEKKAVIAEQDKWVENSVEGKAHRPKGRTHIH